MIKVRVGNNTNPTKEIIVSDECTVIEAFKQAGISYERGLVNLDGYPISKDRWNNSLTSLGASDDSTLMSIIKNDNAR